MLSKSTKITTTPKFKPVYISTTTSPNKKNVKETNDTPNINKNSITHKEITKYNLRRL